jgi:formylmethanofuran dehydrogenase subunit B
MRPPPVSSVHEHVPCPFCGLLCDDLHVRVEGEALSVQANGCERSRVQFALTAHARPECLVDGAPAPLEQAVARAASILSAARLPLLVTAGTDVAGMRALLELADRIGAVVDHAASESLLRNVQVLQNTGWVTTTLSEVRNRADLLVLIGGDVVGRFPRLFERCIDNASTLFDATRKRPELVFLGAKPPASGAGRHVALDVSRLGELFAALRALHAGARLDAPRVAGVEVSELAAMLARMQQARYGVIVWAAADLAFPHAELAIQSLCELVQALNATTRFCGLPLGGSDGDITAHQVITWQSGVPLRTRFTRSGPEYDPYLYSAERLLHDGEADALLYVAALDAARTPPATRVPTIVLGRAGMKASPSCAVHIPVATPGIDQAGHLYRTDNVVAVRVRKLVERALPPAHEVLLQIGARVAQERK